MTNLFAIAGGGCLIYAGWQIAEPLGFAVAGVLLMCVAIGWEKLNRTADKK